MLVISRKQHEFIQIGNDVVVKVIRTSRGSVKIGIDAPGGVSVLRGELSDDGRGEHLPVIRTPLPPRYDVASVHESEKLPHAEAL